MAALGTAAQGGAPVITRSIDNPAARIDAISWSNWDQSYEVGPPYWIHAQLAPILTDVIPMPLMLASQAACVAGVSVISAGRLTPNTGPPAATGADFAVVVVTVLLDGAGIAPGVWAVADECDVEGSAVVDVAVAVEEEEAGGIGPFERPPTESG